jgi:hypothetical protein
LDGFVAAKEKRTLGKFSQTFVDELERKREREKKKCEEEVYFFFMPVFTKWVGPSRQKVLQPSPQAAGIKPTGR